MYQSFMISISWACIFGCVAEPKETIVSSTLVKNRQISAAWFVRETHATVASTYVLKVAGDDHKWTACAVFQRMDVAGPDRFAKLSLTDRRLRVEYRSADILEFSNQAWVRVGADLVEVRIKLSEIGSAEKE